MLARFWQKMKVDNLCGQDAAALSAAWRALGVAALEPAAFQSAEFALPILKQTPKASVATVKDGALMMMAVPWQQAKGFERSIPSPFIASGLPQVVGHSAQAAVLAFMNARQVPFLFCALPTESAFYGLLEQAAPQLHVIKRWKRAALQITGTYEQWLTNNFDHKRRKELKRLRARLSEQGELKFESLNHSGNLDGFVNDLLELEGKGWKGARGTAMKADAQASTLFGEICANLHRAGTLRFWSLKLNGKPIASLFGMVEGTQGWIVKIAYDEAFAKFSPGVLLVLDATAALFAEPNLKLIDSCAIPGHPMIDRIWRDRIDIADVLVAPARVSRLRFATTVAALLGHARLRETAKSIFYRLTKRKRS